MDESDDKPLPPPLPPAKIRTAGEARKEGKANKEKIRHLIGVDEEKSDEEPYIPHRVWKGTKYKKWGSLKEDSKPHTVWVRHDIWEAAKLKSKREGRTLRSIFEEALWKLLMEDYK